jgi:DHA1 family multidrug resistance protein-like MFS transporter
MAHVLRDAPIGQLLRYVTSNRVLRHPEEQPDFVCPSQYASPQSEKPTTRPSVAGDLTAETASDESLHELNKTESRTTLEPPHTEANLENASAAASESPPSTADIIQPVVTADGTILVDWYTVHDSSNPQNWSSLKKITITSLIGVYTTAVYTGSAIYTPSAEGVMERFGVSATAAALGIALFVFAYGIGPLIFTPLSEVASIGRNPPYIFTFAIFTILCLPTAMVDNFAGLLVLRFLQGFFGSPILATGGASLQDMFSLIKLPYVLCCWAAAACIGPALGPVISGFSVPVMGWRWSMWEMLWLAGPVWLVLFFCLPETNPETILLRRAQRLRALTGNQNLKAQSEINHAKLSFKQIIVEALIRPVQLIALDPAIVSRLGGCTYDHSAWLAGREPC